MSVYLDHNATTPLDPRVLEAMLPYMGGIYGNPSSVHRYGRLVRGALDKAREQVAALVGAHPSQVIFTSCGTEANNLALHGALHSQPELPGHFIVGALEHASVLDPAEALVNEGRSLAYCEADANGIYRTSSLLEQLQNSSALVSCMLANNETGAIQPVKQLAQMARDQNVWFHTDATQAAGKIPVNFHDLGVNLMTLSSHKIYGPLGAGALISDKTIALQAGILGGGQEKGLRSGTENVAAIVGFGEAAALALSELQERQQHMQQLRDRLQAALLEYPAVTVFAEAADRLPNTLQFGIEGFHGETTLMKLDCRGIAVSSGSACHAERVDPSHVLLAMGVDPELALTAIRVSVGKDSTMAEVDKMMMAVGDMIQAPLRSAAMAANL